MASDRVQLKLPPKLLWVFQPPRGALRTRGAYGGRSSAKSRSFATMAALFGAVEPLRILCTRELQNSIRESLHAEIAAGIREHPWLESVYEIGDTYISGRNGTEFIFRGLRHNMGAIKSMARIDLCLVEEAEQVPESSWRALLPTIRAPKSEIWPIWNPETRGSPVDQRYRQHPPPRSRIVRVNYQDNPWFPSVMEEQRLADQERMSDEVYAHIWDGEYLENTEARIIPADKIRVEAFEPGADWAGPYYGLDFGFAKDPTAGVKCWINGRRLFIEYETGGRRIDIDHTAPKVIAGLPGVVEHVLRCDSARPESISYLQRHGLPRAIPAKKWPGSVKDGIEHLLGYLEIVIHPRCVKTRREARYYSYKVDRVSGDILPEVVDDWNHYWDAVRYALGGVIRPRGGHKIEKG